MAGSDGPDFKPAQSGDHFREDLLVFARVVETTHDAQNGDIRKLRSCMFEQVDDPGARARGIDDKTTAG